MFDIIIILLHYFTHDIVNVPHFCCNNYMTAHVTLMSRIDNIPQQFTSVNLLIFCVHRLHCLATLLNASNSHSKNNILTKLIHSIHEDTLTDDKTNNSGNVLRSL